MKPKVSPFAEGFRLGILGIKPPDNAEMVKAGTHTQAQAAREVGITRQSVRDACKAKPVITPAILTPKPPMIRLTKDPSRTAANKF